LISYRYQTNVFHLIAMFFSLFLSNQACSDTVPHFSSPVTARSFRTHTAAISVPNCSTLLLTAGSEKQLTVVFSVIQEYYNGSIRA
jgi:hypothetical protein